LHILMALYNRTGKGTYWRALHLARSLNRLGHRITLLCTSPKNRIRFSDHRDPSGQIHVVEAPDALFGSMRSGYDFWASLARAGWTSAGRFDLVHGFECRPVVLASTLIAKHSRGLPLFFDWCDWFGKGGSVEERSNGLGKTLLRLTETYFEQRFRPLADGNTVINRFLQKRAMEMDIPPARILVLPNGCDTEGLHPVHVHEARVKLGWPEDVFVVCYMGAAFQRDALLMAQAFDAIHAVLPHVRLLLLGGCNIAVERLTRRPDAVWRTGPLSVEALNLHLGASDVCWLPLRNTGANQGRLPMKLNDYMAAGRPVVTTHVGELGDLVTHWGFGLVADDSADDLASMVILLERDQELRATLGRRARQVAEVEFSWRRAGEALDRFYRTTLEQQR